MNPFFCLYILYHKHNGRGSMLMEIKAVIGSQRFTSHGELETYFQPFRQATIGADFSFATPFGQQRMIYADWTASGAYMRQSNVKSWRK